MNALLLQLENELLHWELDAIGRSSDTSIVSPRFDCVLSPELPKAVFKLMIYPKARLERVGCSAQ
eukprot:5754185-Amphidinium_carterae.2